MVLSQLRITQLIRLDQRAINLTKTLRTPEHIYLCQQLKKARQDAGLTQTDLAELIGKPQSYVAKIETHERRLDVVEFVRWMEACSKLKHSNDILLALSKMQ